MLLKRRPGMATMSISLPESVRDWIEERIRSGRYASASDYIGELIREDQEYRQEIERALIEGEKSGISTRSVREIIEDTQLKIDNGQI
jgi:antitoxin ParD1/3/4